MKKRLVLIGIGNSHLYLLRYLKKIPTEKLEIYIILNYIYHPVSDTLPGYISRKYSFNQSHIDIIPIVRWLNCEFIHSKVKQINPEKKSITLKNTSEIFYDFLSINTGSFTTISVPFVLQNTIFSKPIPKFIADIDKLIQNIIQKNYFHKIAIIGGSITSIELAFALYERIREELQKSIKAIESFSIQIFTSKKEILPELTQKQRLVLLKNLYKAGIKVHTEKNINKITKNSIQCNQLESFEIDYSIICSGDSVSDFIKNSSLKKDEKGFLLTHPTFQLIGYDNIFTYSDIATIQNTPSQNLTFHKKQESILAKNIIFYIQNKKLIFYKPQKNFSKIITTSKNNAIFCNRFLNLQGSIIDKIKKKVDFKFLKLYKNLPAEESQFAPSLQEISSSIFNQALKSNLSSNLLSNPKAGEDYSNQNIFFIKKKLPDYFLFGKIAANYCTNKFWAKEITIDTITPFVFLQKNTFQSNQENLKRVLDGIQSFCQEYSINIKKGRVFEKEYNLMKLGMMIKGEAKKQQKKNDFYANNLIITKPIGTGMLLQAFTENKIQGQYYQVLINHLLLSNKKSIDLAPIKPFFCVDIGSRGILPSIFEKLDKNYKLILNINKIPVLDGFTKLQNVISPSKIQKRNESLFPQITINKNILFNPQTCGPLVFTIPVEKTTSFLKEIQKKGYKDACVLGSIAKRKANEEQIALKK